MKVLLTDDSNTMRKIQRRALNDLGGELERGDVEIGFKNRCSLREPPQVGLQRARRKGAVTVTGIHRNQQNLGRSGCHLQFSISQAVVYWRIRSTTGDGSSKPCG